MYFVFSTLQLVSPSLGFELLNRIAKIIQDYTASLTEEAIRLNFILVYELLDEVIDFGYPQSTLTESLKTFVHTTPHTVQFENEGESIIDTIINSTTKKSVPPRSSVRPIHLPSQLDHTNEVYVDLWEHMTVLYASNGDLLRNEINGKLIIKSYLKGKPTLALGLSEDFTFGAHSENNNNAEQKQSVYSRSGIVVDDCSFHECASNGFNENNILHFQPPQGEFTLLKYRISQNTYSPFLVNTHLETGGGKGKMELIVKLRSNYSNRVISSSLSVKIPLPKSTLNCTHSLDYGKAGQLVEYKTSPPPSTEPPMIHWTIGKLRGGMETILRVKLNTDPSISESVIRREIGPVSLEFEIQMFSCSTIQIKFLKPVGERIPIHRWIRYITDSKSYVCRV
eukprot:gene4143-5183_t